MKRALWPTQNTPIGLKTDSAGCVFGRPPRWFHVEEQDNPRLGCAAFNLHMTRFSVEPTDQIPLRIEHEDEHLLVVYKPSGLVTQPGKGHERGTLLNALFARYGVRLQNLGQARDFGLLHRLDRGTSGLLIVALTALAYDRLREAFAGRRVKKFYWAVVRGQPNKPAGIINRPILEVTGEIKRAKLSSRGKAAITAYRVVSGGDEASVLECRTITGRLHQVRVHLASIHCPIFGDEVYAPASVALACRRLALHAHRVSFAHPVTGGMVDVGTEFPQNLRALLRRLRLSRLDSRDDGHQLAGDGVGEEDADVGEQPTA